MRQSNSLNSSVVHIFAVVLVACTVSCETVRAGLVTGSSVRSASPQPSTSAPPPATAQSAPPPAAPGPAASPYKSPWDNKPTNVLSDITGARAKCEQSPGNLELAKDYAMTIYNAAEQRKFAHPPTPEWTNVATDAAARLDSIRKSQSLDEQGQVTVHTWRGTMLVFLGKNAEALPELEGNLKVHPSNLWIARQVLKVHKDTKSVADNEAFCKRMRKTIKPEPKKAADDGVRELMTLCIEEHPENASGKVDPDDFNKFVPWASAADDKVLKRFVFGQACVHESQRCFNRCIPMKPCNSRPFDQKWTAECKHNEKVCKEGCEEHDNACFKKAESGKNGVT